MTLLDAVATYLVANTTLTVGGTTGTLAKAQMLDTQPDTVAVLYETGGAASEYAFSTSTGQAQVIYERPNLQLLSRSATYQTARTVAETVYTTLDGLGDMTMSGTRYLDVDAVQAPFSIGRDKQERELVSVNFRIRKEVG